MLVCSGGISISTDETTLILRLNLQGEEAVGAAERCCIALQNFAVIQGLAPMLVLTEIVPQLSRGRSGKAQRVKAAPGAYSS